MLQSMELHPVALLHGPYRPHHRPRPRGYFRPMVLLTSAVVSLVGVTAALVMEHLIFKK